MLVADKALKDVVFFSIDQSMRQLRAYSTRRFAEAGFDLTVDQWLVLKRVSDGDGVVSQTEIADMLGKDAASMTRILDILVKKELLFRRMNETDRRRFDLIMTEKGVAMVQDLMPIVLDIRQKALSAVTDAEVLVLRSVLEKIMANLG
jgi:MarR family transcriptional regulator, transcriptional regulator for hemolysin